VKKLIGFIVLGGLAALLFAVVGGGGSLDGIKAKVASDAVEKYGIAKRNGSPVDICVQAGMVTAAFLQAKDEPNYAKWKATQGADCKRAGVAG
jgi:hypothetical protein